MSNDRIMTFLIALMLIGGVCMADNSGLVSHDGINAFGVVCDKCGSEDIQIHCQQAIQEHPKQKMSEFNSVMTSDCLYRPITYNLKCKKCGYECSVTR